MDTDNPEVATVTPKGQITIQSRLREQFGLQPATKLIMRNRPKTPPLTAGIQRRHRGIYSGSREKARPFRGGMNPVRSICLPSEAGYTESRPSLPKPLSESGSYWLGPNPSIRPGTPRFGDARLCRGLDCLWWSNPTTDVVGEVRPTGLGRRRTDQLPRRVPQDPGRVVRRRPSFDSRSGQRAVWGRLPRRVVLEHDLSTEGSTHTVVRARISSRS